MQRPNRPFQLALLVSSGMWALVFVLASFAAGEARAEEPRTTAASAPAASRASDVERSDAFEALRAVLLLGVAGSVAAHRTGLR